MMMSLDISSRKASQRLQKSNSSRNGSSRSIQAVQVEEAAQAEYVAQRKGSVK
jgi:hypothetical protein